MDNEKIGRFSQKEKASILILRTDRIGDVVLSTPVFTSIRRARPGWKISVLVRPLVAELLEGHNDIDEVIQLDTNDKPGFLNTRNLSSKLKERSFDAAIHLFSDFWISLACRRAGIPINIGPASKIAQVFYNARIVQSRSRGEKHETDYNLDMLKPFDIPPIRISSINFAETLPENVSGLLNTRRKNVGIYPGMGKSARNWKPEKYAQLADRLSDKGLNIILIGGPGEEPLIESVNSRSAKIHDQIIGMPLKELAGFIKRLDCLVAPSTGPLHISTAVGTPAVGVYCPIHVCLPSRWGPIGERDTAFVPDVPVCEECVPDNCENFDCMDKLSIEPIVSAVLNRL